MKQIILGSVFVFYPLIVFFGLQWVEPAYIALALVCLAGLRFYYSKTTTNIPFIKVAGINIIILLMLSFFSNSSFLLKLYPVVMSLSFLSIFLYSIIKPPAVITLIAGTRGKLTVNSIEYTKKVTKVWCVFFLANALISLVTVFLSDEIWALYNGLISYVLMGVLFLGEWIVRKRFKANDQSDYIT